MKKLTFEEYISDYQIVSHKNIDLLDECGLSEHDLTEETIFVIVFNNGGYIECTSHGLFYAMIDRSCYENTDWKNIARHVFDWCDGEYFEAVNAIDQTIAEIDALLAEYPREKDPNGIESVVSSDYDEDGNFIWNKEVK